MTIAEVFLLLMFVMWLASTIKGAASNQGSIDAAMWKEKFENSDRELKAARADAKRLQDTVEALRVMMRADTTQLDDLIKAYKQRLLDAADAAKRGHPKCADDNVLLEVEQLDGSTSATIISPSISILKIGGGAAPRFEVGVRLGPSDVAALLEAVRRLYAQRDCRFDYRLRYRTNDDYHDAREKFEVLFLPATRIRQ